jgi:pimeloyl-ACP methyl ester carboxylesterase
MVHGVPAAAFAAAAFVIAHGSRLPFGERIARGLGLIGARTKSEDLQDIMAHLREIDARTLQRMARSAAHYSALPFVASLTPPLLVITGDEDVFAPASTVGVPLHRAVRGSELVRLADGTHTAMLEQPEVIAEAIERFSARQRAAVMTPSAS